MRILHFSDIHLPTHLRSVPGRDWLSKRMVGSVNLILGRAARFADGPEKMVALDHLRRQISADLVICTGDYTALGTLAGLRRARQAVQPLMEAPLGYAHVPGNHDLYLFDVLRRKWWEETFGDTFQTDLPHHLVDDVWPFVRLFGDDVAVVGVNSARPNPLPWRSSGKIPASQLAALQRVLADKVLRGRFVLVITHYAPRLEDGGHDKRLHGLVNADELLAVCADLQHGAILCGHVHRRYMVRIDGVRPAIFCAGSATLAGAEALWVFDIEGDRVLATPGRWQNGAYVLDSNAAVDA